MFMVQRYLARMHRLKTFNAEGMDLIKGGDFTKLKQVLFIEFLEDYLLKMREEWDEELEFLRSDYNEDRLALGR